MGASSECRSGVRPCVLAFVAFFEVLLVRGPHSIPPSPLLIAAAGSNKIVEGDTETVRRPSLGNFEMDSSWRTSGWFLGSILNFWWLNGLVCYCNLQLIVKKWQWICNIIQQLNKINIKQSFIFLWKWQTSAGIYFVIKIR